MQYQIELLRCLPLDNTIKILNMLVRFGADCRINPHAPPFKQTPANLFKFNLCSLTPQARHLSVNVHTGVLITLHVMPIDSRYELLGSPILFDTRT